MPHFCGGVLPASAAMLHTSGGGAVCASSTSGGCLLTSAHPSYAATEPRPAPPSRPWAGLAALGAVVASTCLWAAAQPSGTGLWQAPAALQPATRPHPSALHPRPTTPSRRDQQRLAVPGPSRSHFTEAVPEPLSPQAPPALASPPRPWAQIALTLVSLSATALGLAALWDRRPKAHQRRAQALAEAAVLVPSLLFTPAASALDVPPLQDIVQQVPAAERLSQSAADRASRLVMTVQNSDGFRDASQFLTTVQSSEPLRDAGRLLTQVCDAAPGPPLGTALCTRGCTIRPLLSGGGGRQGGFLVRSLVDGAGSYTVAHRAGLLPTELTGMSGWILLRSPHQGRGSTPAPAPTKQKPEYDPRCSCWGDFVDVPTPSTVKYMCFQTVEGNAIALLHCVPLQCYSCLFHGFLRASLSPTPDEMVIGCLPPSSSRPSVGSTCASSNRGTKE